ncbi:MAG TPA: phage tail protein [Kofleriaceae bacterium]|nr:phage tail protein [Kofleriaceae bacterium]
MANNFYPLPSFCFKVTVGTMTNSVEAYFRSVSGLRSETEVLPVKEGGVNHTQWQLYNGTKWSNLVLKRGFSGAPEFAQWRQDWITGKARHREEIKLQQLDSDMKTVLATWTFKRGWPVKWELSEFDASKSELSIETLEIAHDGMTFSSSPRK